MKTWYDETARWVDATLKTAAAESPANAALLSGWAKSWRDTIAEGLQPLAWEIFGVDAQQISAEVTAAFTLRAAKVGVLV